VNEKDTEEKFLRVSAGSNAQSVGSAIAHALYESPQIKLRAVGASAVNQAVKACAIARGFVAPRGVDLCFIIGFDDIVGDNGETISAIAFRPVAR